MVDYSVIESDFECSCGDVIKDLAQIYKSDYHSGGPGRLEAFLDLIKHAFEKAEAAFINTNNLVQDPEALRRIRQIAKTHAKKCVEEYAKTPLV
ncbi:hypothetical protein ACLI09_08660 [Flavobacterium sp. RHBU_24]|uniref:hypothetical protein n=1 Tax=Flavobacterium sp. RHBU_24 TaxID=3391185 RepID=UPI003984A2F9